MKKNLNFNYHTCYDELLSKLFLMTYEEKQMEVKKCIVIL